MGRGGCAPFAHTENTLYDLPLATDLPPHLPVNKRRCFAILIISTRIPTWRLLVMYRWLFVPALALGLLAAFTSETEAQKKKKALAQPPAEVLDPVKAVGNRDVHPELKATLFVSEPKITNPSNLDIDHRRRIWLCDVI